MHQHVKIKRCLSSVVNLWSYSACIRQKSFLISGAYLSKRSTLGRGLALNAWHTDRLWRHQVSGQCLSPSHIYHTRMALVGVCPCVCSIYLNMIFRKHCWHDYENVWICQVFSNIFILCSYRWMILRTVWVS